MTEAEWLGCTQPPAMLIYLRRCVQASDRKLRLFVAACARSLRQVFGDDQEVAADLHEKLADGQISKEEFLRAWAGDWFTLRYPTGVVDVERLRPVWESAKVAAQTAVDFTHLECREKTEADNASIAMSLHDIFGNPFRPAKLDASWVTWNNGAVVKLAKEMYESNEFDRMPVLGDLLERAGCGDAEVLSHCRGPGPHVKGCYVVDLLLNKA